MSDGCGLWNTDKELVSGCIFIDQFITLALGLLGHVQGVSYATTDLC